MDRNRCRVKRTVSLLLVLFVLLGGLSPTVTASEGPSNANVLGQVVVNNEITFAVENLILMDAENEGILAFQLNVQNNSNSELNFIDYWVKLNDKKGNNITVNNYTDTQSNNEKIAAKSFKTFKFYSKINKDTKINDLVFSMIKWDFSKGDFETVLGKIEVPDQYNSITQPGTHKTVSFSNANLDTYIERVSLNANDKYSLPFIYFELTNKSSQSVKPNGIEFMLKTKDGLLYPLTVNGITENTVIQPLETKEISLSGSIPVSAGTENWELLMTHSIKDKNDVKISLPLSHYDLPAMSKQEVSIGNTYDFSTNDGTYTAVLESIHRLPWEDDDVLSAKIKIANLSTTTVPVPDFDGYFKLNDVIRVEADALIQDRVVGIAPSQEVTLHLYGKIPYTSQFERLELNLQHKTATDGSTSTTEAKTKTEDLVQFFHTSELTKTEEIPIGGQYQKAALGSSANYMVQSLRVFDGAFSKKVAVNLIMENAEKRSTNVGVLFAQFKTNKDLMIPAEVTEIKSKVMPGGKAHITLQGTLRKDVAVEDMKLIIGDAISLTNNTDSKTTDDKKADGYINAVSFRLNTKQEEPKDSFKELNLYPYTLSLSRIGTKVEFTGAGVSEKVELTFDYELTKDDTIETAGDRKIIVEMKDKEGVFTFEQELGLEKTTLEKDKTATSDSPEDKTLKIGKHDITLSKVDNNLLTHVRSLKTYQLNVYEQISTGYKRLIATKELEWFIYGE
ncbi:hypothetical protein [Paenibacillus turpanensis]|uniref:hypothetical protein n=1 Tax=Paenibacillus turpanensis TaxID=2689078 RepID=UPI0014075161|nr:hypothetical protein [Paenibacillus turpanensis]